MNGPEDTPTVASGGVPHFHLALPQVIAPVSAEAARTAVPLLPDVARAVDAEVARGVDNACDVAAIGCQAVTQARELLQAQVLPQCLPGDEGSATRAALAEIRRLLDALDPVTALAERRLLGVIPFGNGLRTYARQVEAACPPLQNALTQLLSARAGVHQDIAALEALRCALWEAMQALAVSVRLACGLEQTPAHAAAARARQAELLAQQVACVTAYLALDALKKSGRALLNGCDRIETSLGQLLREFARSSLPEPATLREKHGQASQAVAALAAFCTEAAAILARNRATVAAALP